MRYERRSTIRVNVIEQAGQNKHLVQGFDYGCGICVSAWNGKRKSRVLAYNSKNVLVIVNSW